jgi:hypothetical protein
MFGSKNYIPFLYKKVSGTQTEVTIFNPRIAQLSAGDRVGVECIGNIIRLYINRQLVATLNDSANNTGTKVGLRGGSNTTFFDNMIGKPLA